MDLKKLVNHIFLFNKFLLQFLRKNIIIFQARFIFTQDFFNKYFNCFLQIIKSNLHKSYYFLHLNQKMCFQ